ncbi:MAG TPA: hypothetical protein PLG17_08515, partial [Thermodesulfobacteriota bacterium]|nr:hypothetical protein [Thermodesulfobacteriota bacterium]
RLRLPNSEAAMCPTLDETWRNHIRTGKILEEFTIVNCCVSVTLSIINIAHSSRSIPPAA